MEKRIRKDTQIASKYSFSSDDKESDDDDNSLFVLDTTEINFDYEKKPKKTKVKEKSRDKSNTSLTTKNIQRSKKNASSQYNAVQVPVNFDSTSSIRSSVVNKTTKRSRKNQDDVSGNSRPKKIKLETSEFIPDLNKVKTERDSVGVPVNRVKLEKSDKCNETLSDFKPDLDRIKVEKSFKISNEFNEDCKPKPNLQDTKVKTKVKKEPNCSELTSKKTKKIKSEVKQEPDSSEPVPKKSKKVKSEMKQEPDSGEPVPKKSKKVKSEVKEEPDSSEHTLKKPKRIKSEVKQEPNSADSILKKSNQIKREVKEEPHSIEPTSKKAKKIKTEVKQETDPCYMNEDRGENVSGHRISCKLGEPNWETKMLSDKYHIDFQVARNIITMLKNECTIPFIARYRRDQTGGLDADQLRHVKDAYNHIKTLETKIQYVKKKLQKIGKMSPELERSLNGVQSLEELDFIYVPYKQKSCISKAEKARALGLEDAALLILNGNKKLIVNQFIDSSKDGLKNNDEVIQNIQNIVADLFSKNDEVLEYLHELEKTATITIKSTKTKVLKDKENDKSKKKTANEDFMGKFEIYYDFETTTSRILPHQVLALNRGENLKVLSVKMIISDWLQKQLYSFCERKWLHFGRSYALRKQMFRNSFNDAYSRLIAPLLIRRAKSDLNQKAQRAAIENFAMNLRSLLQTPPIKGCSILGIDPGFRHGCKFALINSNGDLLWTQIFYFDLKNKNSLDNENVLTAIREKLIENQCELIAIGNGTGCRAVEAVISHFISTNFFKPELNIQYTIVNERGASVYSCTPLAKEEFPNLDPNLVSAVFIARSLQDPLSEYVKVEPKHLGVGMYQHDVPENRLNSALDEIVSECVSFTGVDVNTASVHLLKRISGLGMVKATSIIEWRRQYGPFRNREQLILVNKIGQKTYEQCSGFIRIHAKNLCDERDTTERKPKYTNSGVNDESNPLDTTWIHPESYTTAYLFIDKCKLDLQNLGTPAFINEVKNIVEEEGIDKIATDLNETPERIKLITDALTRPIDYDYRSQFSKPFFKKGLTEMSSLKTGMILTGVVGNVTNFGAFVDIGVNANGLIHISHMKNANLQVGDRVSVEILSVEVERARIGLNLLNVLN